MQGGLGLGWPLGRENPRDFGMGWDFGILGWEMGIPSRPKIPK
jgi:hypothetical protein